MILSDPYPLKGLICSEFRTLMIKQQNSMIQTLPLKPIRLSWRNVNRILNRTSRP